MISFCYMSTLPRVVASLVAVFVALRSQRIIILHFIDKEVQSLLDKHQVYVKMFTDPEWQLPLKKGPNGQSAWNPSKLFMPFYLNLFNTDLWGTHYTSNLLYIICFELGLIWITHACNRSPLWRGVKPRFSHLHTQRPTTELSLYPTSDLIDPRGNFSNSPARSLWL